MQWCIAETFLRWLARQLHWLNFTQRSKYGKPIGSLSSSPDDPGFRATERSRLGPWLFQGNSTTAYSVRQTPIAFAFIVWTDSLQQSNKLRPTTRFNATTSCCSLEYNRQLFEPIPTLHTVRMRKDIGQSLELKLNIETSQNYYRNWCCSKR